MNYVDVYKAMMKQAAFNKQAYDVLTENLIKRYRNFQVPGRYEPGLGFIPDSAYEAWKAAKKDLAHNNPAKLRKSFSDPYKTLYQNLRKTHTPISPALERWLTTRDAAQ